MLIERLLGFEPRASYEPLNDFWYNPLTHASASGIDVSIDRADQIAAVHCARSILSETLAHVPLKVHRRLDRGKEVAVNHPHYRLLHDRANSIQTSMEWREQMMGDLCFRGNCYSEKVPDGRGFYSELRPFNPDRMRPLKLPSFRMGYSYRNENNDPVSYTQDEVFHVRGYTKDGFVGQSPLSAMRDSLGLTVALEMFGAMLFKNGANFNATYEIPGRLSDQAYKRLQEDLEKGSGWSSAHKTKILEEGLKFSKISMTADEAQFLLSRKFQISEIARWFHVPPHLLGDLEKATFSNIEQQSLEFVIFTMVPWFVRWEQRINMDLIFSPETYFAEFVVDGLLRGDTAARWAAYKEAVTGTGAYTRNEVRMKEGLNPLPGLDDPLVPLNMATVDKNGKIHPNNMPELGPGQSPTPQPSQQRAPDDDDEAEARAEQLDRELLGRYDYMRRVVGASAERVMRKEGIAIAKAMSRYADEPAGLQKWAEKFYTDHGKFIADTLCIEHGKAKIFAEQQKERLLVSVKDNSAGALLKELEARRGDHVLEFLRTQEGQNNGASH